MISPSPQFSVTKVGMVNRRRDKPLLTYGRRSSTPDAPASKKRKTTHEPSPLTTPNVACKEEGNSAPSSGTSELAAPSSSVAKEAREEPDERSVEPKVKKGSIMSFFKPIPSNAKKGDSIEAEKSDEKVDGEPIESQEPESTTKRRRKGPRMLRLKPHLPSDLQAEDKENHEPSRGGSSNPLANDLKSQSHKLRSAPSIQTTLNISSRAAFSECRLCDTVWNPSYADDVKYHKKRHAAVLRRRQIGSSTS